MRRWLRCGGVPWCLAVAVAAAPDAPGPSGRRDAAPYVRVLGRKVADFPPGEDLSSPEAAYASMHRAYAAEGDAAWARLSVPRLAAQLPRLAPRPLPEGRVEPLLQAEILEVLVWEPTNAVVLARLGLPGEGHRFDLRLLVRWEGRWLNEGNDSRPTLELAREKAAQLIAARRVGSRRDSRPPVADPAAHLHPFVEFLQREARDPVGFVLDAVARHRVVILGEVHHRPRYWAFNSALVRHPAFARQAGLVALELPVHHQPLVDQFLEAPAYDPQPVIDTLRDMLWMGWPDQPMLDFFKTVWEVNRELPAARRLRILLVDMARPWPEIRVRGDWARYDTDRDRFMAETLLRQMQDRAAEGRHVLFLVGFGHAMLNLTWPGGEPMKSAGWHLRQALGASEVFAVFPHTPVLSNDGRVGGRLALGLFETAFAALNNRPMAFPLDRGPFGEQGFDADPDRPTLDPYREGYQGYLYLGPLEDEFFSPLIPGFYTDPFVRELDRRSRVMFGQDLQGAFGIRSPTAEAFVEWMSGDWGQPRRTWSRLGPTNAWVRGGDAAGPTPAAR